MSTTRPLTGPLLNSGSRIPPRSRAWVKKRFEKYGVSRCAVYVDHTTVAEDIPGLDESVGLYTFDSGMEGTDMAGKRVGLLGLGEAVPECDGWLVASTIRSSAFTLAKALMASGNEQQVITRLYGGQTTRMTAYMDFFSGGCESNVYINHYFDRKFRLNFPVDLRWAVHRCDGSVVKSGQVVIPPGGTRSFDSREMGLGEVEGYLRVELEVENLQSRVQPFIHFWADYISPAGMCRNHQSGWSPWPANTVFNRGYLPLDPELEAVACFYNENEFEVRPKALLHFAAGGKSHAVERQAAPVSAGHMSYQSMTDLFSDVDLGDAQAAYVLLTCDKPLHRPNYYIAKKGTRQYLDTYHQTGGKACHWADVPPLMDAAELEVFRRHGMDPWAIRIPVLPERFGLHAHFGLLSPTICDNSDVLYEVRDHAGSVVHEESARLTEESPMFFDIEHYLAERGINLDQGGLFCIRPDWKDKDALTRGSVVLFGYKHPDAPSLSTSFKGAPAETNLPFCLERGRLPYVREYTHSPLQQSDHFAPGVVDREFDSLLMIVHTPLRPEGAKAARYRIEILDAEGRLFTLQREQAPMTTEVVWLSELLREAGISEEGRYFTVWIKSPDVKLKPYHGLYRRADHALSLDDGSEGTLQREPMVGGLTYEDISDDADFLDLLGLDL